MPVTSMSWPDISRGAKLSGCQVTSNAAFAAGWTKPGEQ
jgi:hypothetical protein